jgi:transcriptional regulator of arginine metabolism
MLIFASNKNKHAIMKVKKSRLDAIRLILSTQEIGSQEELLNELAKEGFTLTQATLSRDLHQLRVVKSVGAEGRYRYQLTRSGQYRHEGEQGEVRPATTPPEAHGYLSIKFSGNIAVIRTKPSYASTLAYHIDNYDFPEIIGTIAGDDTVMLIIAEGTGRTAVLRALRTIIPNI